MKLSSLFTSHMVLPAHKEIVFFGEGEGKAVISLNGDKKEVISMGDKWEITFPPMEYGGPYEINIDLNGDKVLLTDVYVGKVYIFAGQSNMQFKIKESSTKPSDCKSTPMLRLYSTDRVEEGEYFFARDGWVVAEEKTVREWPAIPYLVSEYLNDKTDIAIGAITCYQGASVIESWLPKGALQEIGIDIPIEDRHKDHVDEWFGKWNKDGDLYEFTFSKIAPFSVNGVVWYQGESDTTEVEGKVYAKELCRMIDIWRRDLRDDNLPFIVIQIADYDERNDDGWRMVQKAQLDAEKMLHNVKTVVCRDICESDNIHPPTKTGIAARVTESLCEFK